MSDNDDMSGTALTADVEKKLLGKVVQALWENVLVMSQNLDTTNLKRKQKGHLSNPILRFLRYGLSAGL